MSKLRHKRRGMINFFEATFMLPSGCTSSQGRGQTVGISVEQHGSHPVQDTLGHFDLDITEAVDMDDSCSQGFDYDDINCDRKLAVLYTSLVLPFGTLELYVTVLHPKSTL